MTRLLLAFAATIPLANWMIANVGDCSGPVCTVPVGFGLHAPSGVLIVGLTLVLRDAIHERAGLPAVAGAVLLGALATLAVAPAPLALASLAAFVAAEAVDTGGYALFRRYGRSAAVMASGLVGAVADSAVFLWLAFGSLDYLPGQTVGKLYASIIVALWLARHRYA